MINQAVGLRAGTHDTYHKPPAPAPAKVPDSLNLSQKTMSATIKEDETLKLLKKYYLEALLAQQVDNKLPYDRDNVSI